MGDGREKEIIVTAGAFLGISKSLLASMAKSDSAIESSIVDCAGYWACCRLQYSVNRHGWVK
jgi:hypothetical protein